MTSLTVTTYYTRKIIKYGSIGIVALIFLSYSLKIGKKVWQQIHPPAPPPPTLTFGRLPKLGFPETKNLPVLTYRLETIQGGLPKMPTIGKVYLMPHKAPGLLDLERATAQAQKIGFNLQPVIINTNTYQWKTMTIPTSTLDIDIVSGNFHLLYDYKSDPEILTSRNLPTPDQATQEARNFLTTNNLLAMDLATGSAVFQYYRFGFPDLVQVAALSEADCLRVNLLRTNLDNLKILPPNSNNSPVSFLFSGARSPQKRIIEINYNYYPIEQNSFGTYPLKPINTAWSEIQAGLGYVANLGQNTTNEIIIREVTLAYYDSPVAQNYLQPIYVFGGDHNFFAYVSAIDPKWSE